MENDPDIIPVSDPRAQYLELKGEIDMAVAEVLDSGRYILGRAVGRFEEEIRTYLSMEAVFGCASGTDALILAMLACGIGPGDEVLLPAFTFVAPLEAVVLCGATPRFVDVDPYTFTIDPNGVEEAMTPRTKAVIAVHLFGQCAVMEPILDAARDNGVVVIEDAAQSFGASRHGRYAGAIGDVGCFSFYPTKNLGCMGDGGMVVTSDERIGPRLRALGNHGEVEKYRHEMVGMNSRLDEIQAAILLAKLPLIGKWNTRRAEIAEIYDGALGDVDLEVPVVAKGNSHIYHQYTIQVERRDALMSHLGRLKISTAVHYPRPLHLQPAYKRYAHRCVGFPVSEVLSEKVLSLPIFPHMDDGQVNRVIEGVRSFFLSP